MQLIIQSTNQPIPQGTYYADFEGVEPYSNDYGPALRWHWKIAQGQYAGSTIQRVTSPKPTSANACGKLLAGLLGKALANGEAVDTASLVGKRYLCVVVPTQNGGSKVETVSALPA